MGFVLTGLVSEVRHVTKKDSGELLTFVTVDDIGMSQTLMLNDAELVASFAKGAQIQVPVKIESRMWNGAPTLSVRPTAPARSTAAAR